MEAELTAVQGCWENTRVSEFNGKKVGLQGRNVSQDGMRDAKLSAKENKDLAWQGTCVCER